MEDFDGIRRVLESKALLLQHVNRIDEAEKVAKECWNVGQDRTRNRRRVMGVMGFVDRIQKGDLEEVLLC